MKQFKKFSLPAFPSRGYTLTPLEFKDAVPFAVVRCYYLANFKNNAITGEHCHKVEEEIFIVVQGSVTAIIDSGNGKTDIPLSVHEAIYTPNFVWHGFKNPSSDAVILALSSTNYQSDRSDYIENYEDFLHLRPLAH